MRRMLKVVMSMMLISSLVCGCTSSGTDGSNGSTSVPVEYSDVQEYFNVPISVKAYGENSEEATKLAFERVAQLEVVFSNTIQDSEVNYVNSNAFETSVEVSSDFKTVLDTSLYYSNLTDGAFDFTIDDLISLWGIGTDNPKVPTNDEISKYVNLKDYENILVDGSSVRFSSNTVKLNFGAISKGYIADEMKKVLLENGVTSAILNLGGNVSAIGTKPSGKLWSVAITDPNDTSNYVCSLKVDDMSVVTSGDYEKYFVQDGKKYHHILDTSTGYPADNGISSVTIVGDNGIDCDALSTACFVLGEEKALTLIESIEGYDAIIILNDGSIKTTSNVQDYQFSEMA
ncbi:MAG: FAD:protein FMN transferase [Ruminococcus sp.]|nr:FAD:protein FMN transferase [Ruminococcus sp.]